MVKLLIGVAGLTSIVAIGYITLCAYLGHQSISLREKAVLSPFFFFNSVLTVYVCHLFSGGIVLSRVSIFFVVIVSYLVVHFLLGFHNLKRDILTLKGRSVDIWRSFSKFKLFLVSVLILMSVGIAIKPMLSGMFLSGDLNKHLQFANQLLVGFPYSDFVPYWNTPSPHYPFLVHGSLAFLVRFLGVHLFDAYFILQLLQAILLPTGMFFLVYKLTRSFWAGVLVVVFTTFYGGHDSVWKNNAWWFNPAIERLVPGHITRMLSLCFVPVLFYLFIRISEEHCVKFYVLASGLFLSYTGVCHTYPFIFMCVFYAAAVIFASPQKETLMSLVYVLFVGVGISLIAYFPTIWENIVERPVPPLGAFDTVHSFFGREGGEEVFLTWSRFVNHFGIVGFMALCSVIFLKGHRYRNFYFVLGFAVLAVLVITYAKGLLVIYCDVSLPYHPTQQKFGKVIFLSLLIFGALGISSLVRKIWGYRPFAKAVISGIIIMILFGFAAAGFSTLIDFLKNPWFGGWERCQANEAFRKDRSIVNQLQEVSTKRDVIAAPESISDDLAYLTGVNMLFISHHRAHQYSRSFASKLMFGDKDLWKKAEHASSLNFSILFRAIVKKYGITYLIINEKNREQYEGLACMSQYGEGIMNDGESYLIFRVDRDCIDAMADRENYWNLEEFFDSREIHRLVVGYYPLNVKRTLRLDIFQSRELKLGGLTWGDHALWISDYREKRIFKIDPKTGDVLRVLPNLAFRPWGLTWDGEALWSVDGDKRVIYRLNPTNGEILHTVANIAARIGGLTWGEANLWNLNNKDNKIHKINPADGEVVLTVNCPSSTNGIAWKDSALWITQAPSNVCQLFPVSDHCHRVYGNPRYLFDKLTWTDEDTLWVFELYSKKLIEFDGF